jgi:hypothetical protein
MFYERHNKNTAFSNEPSQQKYLSQNKCFARSLQFDDQNAKTFSNRLITARHPDVVHQQTNKSTELQSK